MKRTLNIKIVALALMLVIALAALGLVIGIVVPLISSRALKESGVNYRREFAGFNSY